MCVSLWGKIRLWKSSLVGVASKRWDSLKQKDETCQSAERKWWRIFALSHSLRWRLLFLEDSRQLLRWCRLLGLKIKFYCTTFKPARGPREQTGREMADRETTTTPKLAHQRRETEEERNTLDPWNRCLAGWSARRPNIGNGAVDGREKWEFRRNQYQWDQKWVINDQQTKKKKIFIKASHV